MKVSKVYGSNFVQVADWPLEPEICTITAVGSTLNKFGNTSNENVIYICLNDLPEMYRVNQTNAMLLVEAFDDETDNWLNKKILLSRSAGIMEGKKIWIGHMRPVLKNTLPTAKPKE